MRVSTVQQRARPTGRSFVILLIIGVPSGLAGWYLGEWIGFLIAETVGLLIACYIEANLIASELGISRRVLMMCGGIRLRGDYQRVGDRVLDILVGLRQAYVGKGVLAQAEEVCCELLKGMNALSQTNSAPPEDLTESLDFVMKELDDVAGESRKEEADMAALRLRLQSLSRLSSSFASGSIDFVVADSTHRA